MMRGARHAVRAIPRTDEPQDGTGEQGGEREPRDAFTLRTGDDEGI